MSSRRVLEVQVIGTSEGAERALQRVAQAADSVEGSMDRAGRASERASNATEQTGSIGVRALGALSEAASRSGQDLGAIPEVLDRITIALEDVDERGSRASKALAAIGAGVGAIGGLALAQSAQSAQVLEQQQAAVDTTGKSWEEYRDKLHEAAEGGARFGYSSNTVNEALTSLTRSFSDPQEALDRLQFTYDLAKAKSLDLSRAAELVGQTHAGNNEVFRMLGIDVRDFVDTEKLLAKTHADVAAAATRVGAAQQALADFEARAQQQRSAAAARHAEQVQAARGKVSDAEQRLADVTAAQAQRRRTSQEAADSAVTSSTARLQQARERLADAEEQLHEKTQLTLRDQIQLRDAQQSVADVQEQIAGGYLQGAAATQALRDAQQRLADTQALQAEKTKVTEADTRAQTDAVAAVDKATREHARALEQQKTASEQTGAEQRAMRDAIAGVTQAHEQLRDAEASSAGGLTLAQLQQERRLRENVQSALAKQQAAVEAEQKARQLAAQQGDKDAALLQLAMSKTAGAAEASSKGISGTVHRTVAGFENELEGLGTTTSLFVVGASAAITGIASAWEIASGVIGAAQARMAAGAVASAATVEVAAATTIAAETGVAAAATTAGAATTIGLGPVLLIVAAVGAAAFLLGKNWDTVWGGISKAAGWAGDFIHDHLGLIALAFGPVTGALFLVHKHWDTIWGAIKASASGTKDFFVTVFEGVADVILAPMRLTTTVINEVIDAINSIHFDFRAPSWAGGFGWKFDGFGIGHLPSFDVGGVVPGQPGQPQLSLVHGQEVILNAAQQQGVAAALLRPAGGGMVVLELRVDLTGAFIADERALDSIKGALTGAVLDGMQQLQNQGVDLQLGASRR